MYREDGPKTFFLEMGIFIGVDSIPPHQCLKEVKLAGYYGCDLDVRSAFYFIDNAIALEKLIIDPHNQKRIFYNGPQKHCETKRERAARERAKKQLKGKAPQRVKLVIL